jgi:hypothetical protein
MHEALTSQQAAAALVAAAALPTSCELRLGLRQIICENTLNFCTSMCRPLPPAIAPTFKAAPLPSLGRASRPAVHGAAVSGGWWC